MKRAACWTVDEDLRVYGLQRRGATYAEISERLGRGRHSIAARVSELRRLGVWGDVDGIRSLRRFSRIPEEEIERAVEMRKGGAQWREISAELGRPWKIYQYNVTRRLSGVTCDERASSAGPEKSALRHDPHRPVVRAVFAGCPVSVAADTPEQARAFMADFSASVATMRRERQMREAVKRRQMAGAV